MTKRPPMINPKPSEPDHKPSSDASTVRATDIRRVLGAPGTTLSGSAISSFGPGLPRSWLRYR